MKYQFIDHVRGRPGEVTRPNMPKMTNLRQVPFERMNWPAQGVAEGSGAYWKSFKHEMWRMQIPLQFIVKYAQALTGGRAALRQQLLRAASAAIEDIARARRAHHHGECT